MEANRRKPLNRRQRLKQRRRFILAFIKGASICEASIHSLTLTFGEAEIAFKDFGIAASRFENLFGTIARIEIQNPPMFGVQVKDGA